MVDREWEQIKETINIVAMKTTRTKRLKSKSWFNRICEKAIHRRKLARQQW